MGDDSDETETVTVNALRSDVLTGEPILDTADVTEAVVVGPSVEGQAFSVGVTLSSRGAKDFEEATREWSYRRIAIVIRSAPVVKGAIGGGHVSITMGTGADPLKRGRSAARLSAR